MISDILIEATEANPFPFAFLVFLSHQDGTDGSHRSKMFWNDELSVGKFQYIQKGSTHPHIGCYPSLKGDGFHKDLPFTNITLEISRQGVTKTSHDVIIWCGNLLKMDHVRFGKDTASACIARWVR